MNYQKKYSRESLKLLCKKNKLTLKMLSKKINVTQATLSRYFNKKVFSGNSAFYTNELEKKISLYFDSLNNQSPQQSNDKFECVYLDCVNDIIDALLDGETICIHQSLDTYKLINGVLVKYNKGNPLFIGGGMDLSLRYYVIRKKPIEICIGNKYVTETGDKGICFKEEQGVFYIVLINNAIIGVNKNGRTVDNSKYGNIEMEE